MTSSADQKCFICGYKTKKGWSVDLLFWSCSIKIDRNMPLVVCFQIAINAWFWSVVFHTRDNDFTEVRFSVLCMCIYFGFKIHYNSKLQKVYITNKKKEMIANSNTKSKMNEIKSSTVIICYTLLF